MRIECHFHKYFLNIDLFEPNGGLHAPFLYLLSTLPLVNWVCRRLKICKCRPHAPNMKALPWKWIEAFPSSS